MSLRRRQSIFEYYEGENKKTRKEYLFSIFAMLQQIGFVVSTTDFGLLDNLYFLDLLIGSFDEEGFNIMYFAALTPNYLLSWVIYAYIEDRPNVFVSFSLHNECFMEEFIIFVLYMFLFVSSIFVIFIFFPGDIDSMLELNKREQLLMGFSLGIIIFGLIYFGLKLISRCSKTPVRTSWKCTRTACEFGVISSFIPFVSLGNQFESLDFKVMSFIFAFVCLLLLIMLARNLKKREFNYIPANYDRGLKF